MNFSKTSFLDIGSIMEAAERENNIEDDKILIDSIRESSSDPTSIGSNISLNIDSSDILINSPASSSTSISTGSSMASSSTDEPCPLLVEAPVEGTTNVEAPNPLSGFNISDMSSLLNNDTISDVMKNMTQQPEKLTEMLEKSMKHVSPEMMDQARKLVNGGQGDRILKEMQRRGLNPHAMRSKIKDHQKNMKGLGTSRSGPMRKAIIITLSRKLKSRNIPIDSTKISIDSILKSTDTSVEILCSRLSQGPLVGKTVRLFYNSLATSKNRRASRVAGFQIGGDVLCMIDDYDITESDFVLAEKCIG